MRIISCLLLGLGSGFLTSCLVLGSPKSVYLQNLDHPTEQVRLISYPNGFYQYQIFRSAEQPDSVQIFDPIKRVFVTMNSYDDSFSYRFKAKVRERDLLGRTVIRRFHHTVQSTDTLVYSGSLRKLSNW